MYCIITVLENSRDSAVGFASSKDYDTTKTATKLRLEIQQKSSPPLLKRLNTWNPKEVAGGCFW